MHMNPPKPFSAIPLPAVVNGLEPLATAFESYPMDGQVNWMRSLGGGQLKALWYLAEKSDYLLDVDDFAREDGAVTVCRGKNHLPIFSWFEKRFVKIDGEVVGYNETGWQKSWVGPGHFVLRPSPEIEGELWVDYRLTPKATHPDFPALHTNDRLMTWPGPFARLAYGGLLDRLRRVSDHLLIGRSCTQGLSLQAGAFFALHLPSYDEVEPD
ncbi:MAG: hypothetical protein ACI9MC_004278 [Kiritimatiellia bacterium]|jgi:hypothetical protein